MTTKSTDKFFFAAVLAVALLVSVAGFARGRVFWEEAGNGGRAVKSAEGMPTSFAPLAKKTMPAVVTVYTRRSITGTWFFSQREFIQQGEGSGFIISTDGYVLTNYHVVKGSESINVMVGEKVKKEYKGELVGYDPELDVALVKIEPEQELPVLPLGDSDELQVGDWVAAIGSPFNFPHTFTVGVVSAKGRRLGIGNYDDFIQTDASINQGNSGGPLVDMSGNVVGINTLIVSPSRGSVGIGFSIPVNLVKTVLPQLKEQGKVVRSWLGVTVEEVTRETADELGMDRPWGARVVQVVVNGPADKVGLEAGDVIVEFDGERIKESRELPQMVSSFGVGREVAISWTRDGERINRKVVLERLPSPQDMAKMQYKSGESMDNPLGVAVRELKPDEKTTRPKDETRGVIVDAVARGSAAANNGIRPGDVITKVNFTEIGGMDDFQEAMDNLAPGDLVKINIRRGPGKIFRIFQLPSE